VEQQPQKSIHQPSPVTQGRLLPRQREPPPGELFPGDVEHKKWEPGAEDPVPAEAERLEGHERRVEIRLALQPPERGAEAAGQHADGREPPGGPEPVAAVHRPQPQPRDPGTLPSSTPFPIQQQAGQEKQGAKNDSACGHEPHHDGLSPGGGDERRDGEPCCQEQQQSTGPEQRGGADQTQRRNPIRLRPFAPFDTDGTQWALHLPFAERPRSAAGPAGETIFPGKP
jgi:hypothetical protein